MLECKGSWKASARNIKYNGRSIECELQNIKGEYVPNQMDFFPNFFYENIDGRFEWNQCKNGVEFNNLSHEHISRRYKEIKITHCLEYLTNEYDSWFHIEKKIIKCVKDRCISVSLFRKNANNLYENEYPVNANWKKKYYDSLIHNLNHFDDDRMCVNLYLARDLHVYISELSKYSFLNIFLMKSESIGAQPGTLWRFIDITNQDYQTVFLVDIDENWLWVKEYDEEIHTCKLTTIKNTDNVIGINPLTPAYNFPTILAGHSIVKPHRFSYNIVDVMKGFISLCKAREKSRNPYCFFDNDPITLWNQPVGYHKYGWGRLITVYGFDEFFLKHVVYHDAYPDIEFIE
jgi:hypothetical protein